MTKEEFKKLLAMVKSENITDKILVLEILSNTEDVPDLWFRCLGAWTSTDLMSEMGIYERWGKTVDNTRHIIVSGKGHLFNVDEYEQGRV